MNPIRQLFTRRGLTKELSEEIQEHLHETIEALVESGMSPGEAATVARRQFGNVTLLEESAREVWRWTMLEDILADIKYAFRQLRKAPVFAVAAISTLAVGIGANTAVFSVVNAVVLRPLPYAEPDRLVSVGSWSIKGTPHTEPDLSYPTFFDYRSMNQVFDHLVCYRDYQFTVGAPESPTHVDGEIVSWDLFPALGIKPEIGRGFLPEEEKPGSGAVVLSHELWQARFGADPTLVGKSITVDGRPATVAGIAPPGFRFPADKNLAQIWVTIASDATVETGQPVTEQRGARLLNVFGRLKPGVAVDGAHAQMDLVAASLAKQYPENKNIPATDIKPQLAVMVAGTRGPLLVLLAAVGLVLLIACANIASLLLARTAERQHEFCVRAAIGASRNRIVRQLLAESLVLALLGCIAGLVLAFVSLRLLLPIAGDSIPRIGQATLDGRVLGFSIALATLTSVLFSLAPALQVAKTRLTDSLKQDNRGGTRGRDRLRSILVTAQIALGLVLLTGASLLIASFAHLAGQNPGVRTDHVLSFSINLPSARYDAARSTTFYDQLVDRLKALPGAQSAAAGTPLPFTGDQMMVSFNVEERPLPPTEHPIADLAIVTPGYFDTLGIPIVEGRDFRPQDDISAAPVLIVNKAFADKFFPGEDVIGKRIEPGATGSRGKTINEIVGLVGNARQSVLSPDPEPIYYFCNKQLPWGGLYAVVRTSMAPAAIQSSVREAVASIESQEPIFDVKTLDELRATDIAGPRFQMLLLGSFAGVALLLIVVGLYGLLAYSVMKRTREIGLRIALGATGSKVLRLVLAKTLIMVGAGLVIGFAASVAGANLLQQMLYGVGPRDPAVFVIACVLITTTALAAAYVPARRASMIDPVQALRTE
jgi:putative ABC transport system permease protein